MAKPKKNKSGTYTLMVSHQRKRTNLTLGKITKREADHFATNIDRLIDARRHGTKQLAHDLNAWLECLNDRHLEQLSKIGLIDYLSANMTLAELFKAYEKGYRQRSGLANSTKNKVRSTLANRMGRLGKYRISDVEPVQRSQRRNADPVFTEQAEKILKSFNAWQRNFHAPATWTRDNKLLSSIGIWAVKQGYCDHNPFSNLPTSSMVNDERNEYISRDMVIDAMEACLSPDIRITLAMARYCGLRTCSEIRTMKWSDVGFDSGILSIIDSKKKQPRSMPLFDDAREELERQHKETGETRYVVSEVMRSTSAGNNYRKVFDAVARSGQQPWNRLRQNLRTSCENDLLEHFDERDVCRWLGHSMTVSRKHYQKARPSDYTNAIKKMRSVS